MVVPALGLNAANQQLFCAGAMMFVAPDHGGRGFYFFA